MDTWTEITQKRHERKSRRNPGAVTDEEWVVISPLLPGPTRLSRPREVDLRDVRNATGYRTTSGCVWAPLPKGFPPTSPVRYCFHHWRANGQLVEINRRLVAMAREAAGRDSCPTAGVTDSQNVKPRNKPCLCRWWLCRAKAARCADQHRALDSPDRKAFGHGRWLQGTASALGC